MNDSSILNNTIDYTTINISILAATALFSIIGLFANILLLHILIKHKGFGKTTYYLLRISVVSDIISNFVTAAGYLVAAGADFSYFDSPVLCRFFVFITFSSYGVSIMTLCIIAIDRYFVVVRPLSSFYSRYKHQFIGGLFAIVAIMVFSSTFPALFFVTANPNELKFCYLTTVTNGITYYLIICSIMLYIIPALTLAIVYGKIIFYMRNYVRPGESILHTEDENDKRRKFIRMLISVTTAYLFISCPFYVTILGMAITRKSLRQIHQLGLVYYLLAFYSFSTTIAISILNPFLYFKFDKAIRLEAIMHLSAVYNMAKSRLLTKNNMANDPSINKSNVA